MSTTQTKTGALLPTTEDQSKKVEDRNVTYQKNRLLITKAVNEFIQKENYMPSALLISKKVGLSHTAVGDHLKELKSANGYQEELSAFGTQYGLFLSVIAKQAFTGDVKAAKMALDILTSNKPAPTLQINNTNVDVVLKQVLSLVPEAEQEKVQSLIEAVTKDSETIDVESTEIEEDEK